jgi:NAD(P)-dependent dehydrogenase (short-subunit alcohol dehydrogenase family)
MSKKTVLVTGATSGIGLEASVTLAGMGAELILVARDPVRGDAALDRARQQSGAQAVSVMQCDFASLAQIRALAAAVMTSRSRLDVLVNNAGSFSPTREVTEAGIERTFAVNHLGPFLLTNLLTDLLQRSAPARVVTVTSAAHRSGQLPFDNLQFEKGGHGIMRAYSRSKLANVLFTFELARRLAGTGVTANCLHPGTVATNIWSHAPWYAQPLLAVAKLFMMSAEKGAQTIVYLAASPAVEGRTGGYYEHNHPGAAVAARPGRCHRDNASGNAVRRTSASPPTGQVRNRCSRIDSTEL